MDGQVRPDQESGMNISSNLNTQTGSKSLTITAQGEAAEQLAQMLKLAGMAGGSAEHHEPEIEVAVDEEYANEPQPEIQPVSTQMQQGNDLNRIKKQDPATANRAANPLTRSLATAESLELKRIEKRLMEELDSIKLGKVSEEKIGFKKLEKEIAKNPKVDEPAAVAASIGRKKYGKEKFQKMAAAGKKK